MTRFLCVHGHFYQPPRENPWLEAIERQDSAYPFHDWNERITDECYAPNAACRILDGEGRIVDIVNNYSRISFNMGPTLLKWMEDHRPETYQAVLDADRESRERYSGHGSSLAQAYNHMILPLASTVDRITQVLWGLRDFEHRFGRAAEGMWLPETAVDTETLEILARLGVRFTVLAPHQADRVRGPGESKWRDVSGGRIDPRRPYTCSLPSGRTISLFFYDGPLSRAVAFENLLRSGEHFANRLLGLFNDGEEPQLAHIATDGETYGHHHRHGDMALAYALRLIESKEDVRLTNYGEFLEQHPPTHEVRIADDTSWSCAHGIERWRSDCGCHTGGKDTWNQAWRAPLREALDYLRDEVRPQYAKKAQDLLRDPMKARDDYISVVLDRSPENVDAFFARHAHRELNAADRITAIKLLEMERHAMLMYTSCGWFFTELSGIETVQVIQYAGRVLQLYGELFPNSLEKPFLRRLEKARSNIAEHGDGADIYDKWVRPAMVDLLKVGGHYGISSLFNGYGEEEPVYCFLVESLDHREEEAGKTRLALGRARITSNITGESKDVTYGVLHLGDHNVNGGVREFRDTGHYGKMLEEVISTFGQAEFSEMLKLFEKHFGTSTYSLRSLFRDEQRQIADIVMASTLERAQTMQREFYDDHLPAMQFLARLGIPVPRAFRAAADLVINTGLRDALEETPVDSERIEALLSQAESLGVRLDEGLGYAMQTATELKLEQLADDVSDPGVLEEVVQLVELARRMPFEVDLWQAQNEYFGLWRRLRSLPPEKQREPWAERFRVIGDMLKIRVS